MSNRTGSSACANSKQRWQWWSAGIEPEHIQSGAARSASKCGLELITRLVLGCRPPKRSRWSPCSAGPSTCPNSQQQPQRRRAGIEPESNRSASVERLAKRDGEKQVASRSSPPCTTLARATRQHGVRNMQLKNTAAGSNGLLRAAGRRAAPAARISQQAPLGACHGGSSTPSTQRRGTPPPLQTPAALHRILS